ncbi:TetR/AcrR family transcriptional regulator [Streptomyces sp. AGS-58]|uniref:TetR/AcrR family transcriptional regulator n=1 Tax=unclassified Streptomyces TaxID=2593676 RepID=UPI0035A2C8B3
MQTTDAPGRAPQRKDAHSSRRRILTAARQKLREDPDASLDSISRAAGVARRTLYGHFPGRHALIADLTRKAGDELRQAFAAARTPDADPIEAMTRMVLAAWRVGDQYRMLTALGRRHPGEDEIRTTLAPARAEAVATLGRGQREGLFADHLPAPVLAQALEALMLALAEENAACPWADPTGEAAATAFLVAAGVAPQAAALQVQAVITGRDRAAGDG